MVSLLVLRSKEDGQVRGALTDLGRAPHGTRTEPLDRRTLIGVHRLDDQILADELMIVLGIRDRRLEQLAPVTSDRTRRVSEDSACILNALATDVVADQAS